MKVGIISINMYSKGLNFACPLHTYAFQQFLMANGIENTVIDYKPIYYDNFNLEHPYDYYVERYETLSKKMKDQEILNPEQEEKLHYYEKKINSWEPLYKEREIRYQKFQKFIEANYIKTENCYDSDLLEVQDPGFDCYICATDVIWKNQPGCGFDRGYFLGSTCMEQKWKLAYSASRGVYFASDKNEEKQFFHYLEDIDEISVREASLQKYIAENTGNNVPLVLDPVLLHEKEFYDDIIQKPEQEHYLLLYYVMERAKDTISQAVVYARSHNMKIVEITDLPLAKGRLSDYTDIEHEFHFAIGIEEWLGYIKYADCIFTNSFHACCFSILFEKEFYVGFRNGDKVTNVMSTFGLLNRIVTNDNEIQYDKVPKINYDQVRDILHDKRRTSAEFLLSALKKFERQSRVQKNYEDYKKQQTYRVIYNCKLKHKPFTWKYDENQGKMEHLPSGTMEYKADHIEMMNDGTHRLLKNGYHLKDHKFAGWNLRFRIDNRWFWYLEDGSIILKQNYNKKVNGPLRVFKDEDQIPYVPVNRIAVMVAEAVWKKTWIIRARDKVIKHAKKCLKV